MLPPGRCVNSDKGERRPPGENEGVSKYLRGPAVIFPYSVGSYLAQVYHSAKCALASCAPIMGVVCKPAKGQNRFGCDTHGDLVLHKIDKVKPTSRFPLPASCGATCPTLNRDFALTGFLYVVVRYAATTAGHVPSYLEALFGPKGWTCSSHQARADIASYGFAPAPFPPAGKGQVSLKMTC